MPSPDTPGAPPYIHSSASSSSSAMAEYSVSASGRIDVAAGAMIDHAGTVDAVPDKTILAALNSSLAETEDTASGPTVSEIESLANLRPNWDGEGAAPLSAAVRGAARVIV